MSRFNLGKSGLWRAAARALMFAAPIGLGVLIFTQLQGQSPEADRRPPSESSRALRVVEVQPTKLIPRVLAYGTVRPGRVWRAIARVGGDVTFVHQELRNGGRLQKDEIILRVNEAPSKNEIARLTAQVAQTRAQLLELDQQTENDKAALAIEQESLTLAESTLARSEKLKRQSAGSGRRVEEEKRSVLAQKQKIQDLQSRMRLAPSQKTALEASITALEAQLATAQLDLEYTTVRAPFDCVVPEANIQLGQVLAPNEQMFEAFGMDSVEIDSQVTYDKASRLLTPEILALIQTDQKRRTTPEEWEPFFDVKVRQESGHLESTWDGTIIGTTETTDVQTRTFGLVVRVSEPYKNAVPGRRPPLVKGTYCEVDIRSNGFPARIVIPREAIDNGNVYVLDADDRLRRRRVEVAFTQASFAVVTGGVNPGERIVVSDPSPAIEGMLVRPIVDEATTQRIRAEAAGESPIR